MDWNLKKLWPAAASSLVAVTSFINAAADDTQMRNLENRVSALEQRRGSSGMINPPARPMVRDGADLFIEGAVFIWQANETGLEYAMKWNDFGTTANTSGSGDIKHPHSHWDWGFKIGAGINMPHDGWDLFAQWTRFHPEREHAVTSVPAFNASTPPNAVVYPLFLPMNTGSDDGTVGGYNQFGPGFSAAASWKLRLDLIDLELGREFYVSKWLTLRPHIGLRNAWVHQRLHIEYDGLIDNQAAPVQIPALYVNLKNNFWGLGPRAGLNTQWNLTCGFSIFGEFAASLMLGHFNIFESQSPAINTADGSALTPATCCQPNNSEVFRDEFRAMRAALDLAIGLRYQTTFSCDRYGLMLSLGWEHHYFFSQNQLYRLATTGAASNNPANRYAFTPVSNQGDLNTQGVTLTVEFDF